MTKKKDLNRVLENTIKSQININKSSIIIQSGTKGLFCGNFILKGNFIKRKIKKRFMIYLLL